MNHNHDHLQSKNLKTAFFLNFFFAIIEIVGAILTNSVAVLADAFHDLGDSLSLAMAWLLERYAHKQPDSKYTYGYARFSLLGALLNSVILIFGSALIIYNAGRRLFFPVPVKPAGMIMLAVLGIIINGLATWKMQHGSSLNEKVVFWHLLEDVLGWVVVLLGSVAMYFYDLPIIDPLLSIGIALYLLANVIPNLLKVVRIFFEGVPLDYSTAKLRLDLLQNEVVIDVHHLHLWSLEGEMVMASFHIVVKDDLATSQIIELKNTLKKHLKEKGIGHVTIEIDYQSEDWQDHECD